jgi:dolichyl-phosphate beta-glucosyltransferase
MPDVCLVVPCFNEAARLPAAAFLAHLDADARTRILFVDDGSRDGTAARLQALAAERPGQVAVLTLAENRGKAEAVRQGVLHAIASPAVAYVGYWDADLATPLSELGPMRDALEAQADAMMALGSRWRRLGSDIQRRAVRHLLGRVFATAASLVLDLPVYDSQCGAKLFRAGAARALFADPFVTRWLFDVELLARRRTLPGAGARGAGAIEVPLTRWRDVGGSRLGWSQMLATPVGLWRIYRRYGRG